MRWGARGVAFAVVVLSSSASFALKPCATRCDEMFGASCDASAVFVAVGRIENRKVVPFDGGGVKLKFASFDFVVESYEKGGGAAAPKRIKSITKWCYHDDIVFNTKVKKYRVYGMEALGGEEPMTYYAIKDASTSEAYSPPPPKPSASPSPSASAPGSASASTSASASASASPSPSALPSAPSASVPMSSAPAPEPQPVVTPRHCGCAASRSEHGAFGLLVVAAWLARRSTRERFR